MSPVTLMRIASVSKTVTGMAIAKLFEDGKLGLDDKAIDFVKDLQPASFDGHDGEDRYCECGRFFQRTDRDRAIPGQCSRTLLASG